MKKLYSKQLGSEVYALAPEQLKVFASSGYEVPTPEAVIADAGAIRIVPPAGKRAFRNAFSHCSTALCKSQSPKARCRRVFGPFSACRPLRRRWQQS